MNPFLKGMLLALTAISIAFPAFGEKSTLLLKQPTVSEKHIAFVYGGDIWLADRAGKLIKRLTSHPASEHTPRFSPDGSKIAFSANYQNNEDVYVIDVNGGQAKRLTFHPNSDVANGWSKDGKQILFASTREIRNSRSNQLYQINASGGFPKKVMEAVAVEGQWDPSGKILAYRPNVMAHRGASGWNIHRGGQTPPIWILQPGEDWLEKIPSGNSNNFNPMWSENKVYFISDRDNKANNLFVYDRDNKGVTQLTQKTQWNIRSAALYDDSIIFEAGGQLYDYSISQQSTQTLSITVTTDFPKTHAQWKSTHNNIESFNLSSSGKRALVTARGDIYSLPLKDGSIRNLTTTSGLREMNALWSHDGSQIAFLRENKKNASNAVSITHQLVIIDQQNLKAEKIYDLKSNDYLTLLAWSPDSQIVIFQDNHLNLFSIDLSSKNVKKIDSNAFRSGFQLSFSRDSRYLAYIRKGENYFSRLKIHDFKKNQSIVITDGMSDVNSLVFADDDYLYFTASTNYGPAAMGFDLSTQEKNRRIAIYALVLNKVAQSPLAPKLANESQETNAKNSKDDPKNEKPFSIDFDGIRDRIVALPIAERFNHTLDLADDGALYYIEEAQDGISNEVSGTPLKNKLYRFDFSERETSMIFDDVQAYHISSDGKKLLIRKQNGSFIYGDTGKKFTSKVLNTSGMRALINPREEWQQIFDEAWWMQAQYFYDANLHGINWTAIYNKYTQFLPHLTRREDLNDVIVEMIAELQVGHNRAGGGDVHREDGTHTAMLGADFAIVNGKYQIKKIYTGEKWNPFLEAPLAAPGLSVKEGDFLLAINGRELGSNNNIYAALEGLKDTQITLSIANNASGKNQRDIVVEPVANETALRHWYWVEKNRKYVDKATNGKVGYVFLPNTYIAGFRNFNRMFFPQADKKAVILDERKNRGGKAANYMIDILNRQYLAGWKERDGLLWSTPATAIYGPKVMLVDQDSGSGGDFLPYAFQRLKLGKVIGTRTWGGLIGISANNSFIDGGNMVVPFFRFFTPDNEWRVENEGVTPDIEQILDPIKVNKGIDTQLDRAIKEILENLKDFRPVKAVAPPPMPTELGK
ncbi:MAG: PDZ domain-containing protein [Pseudomonadota bacterium]